MVLINEFEGMEFWLKSLKCVCFMIEIKYKLWDFMVDIKKKVIGIDGLLVR